MIILGRGNEAGVKLLYSILLYGDELSEQLAVHIPVSCVFLKLLMLMVTTETVTHKTNSNHLHIQKIPCEYTVHSFHCNTVLSANQGFTATLFLIQLS